MALRAVHAEWGTAFSHLPDLGCGQAWEAVWKVRPPAQIACAECRHPMHAKTSLPEARFAPEIAKPGASSYPVSAVRRAFGTQPDEGENCPARAPCSLAQAVRSMGPGAASGVMLVSPACSAARRWRARARAASLGRNCC